MLTAHEISVRRGRHVILDKLTLTVRPGEILALLGRNGAGKSTLLKAMAGEFQGHGSPLMGSITLNGKAIDAYAPDGIARLRAILPQSSPPVFPFTAYDIALMGRYPHRACGGRHDGAIAHEALATAGAAALAGRDVITLSGGEYTRVQFARVMAQVWPDGTLPDVPRYLLLDEPTAALDLAHQHHLLSVTRQLAREWRLGVLAIMHDVNLAARYADRMALLADGRILALGEPETVMQNALIEHSLGLPVRIVHTAGHRPFAIPA